jgi:putative salt-induced outer membrane protein YdiY
LVDTQGNTYYRSIAADATINLEQERSKQEIKGGIFYGETDRKVDSRHWYGSVRDQHFIFLDWIYYYLFTKVESDPFAGYDLRVYLNPGLGYEYRGEMNEIRIGAGPGLMYEELNLEPKQYNSKAVFRADEKYVLNLYEKFSFYEEAEYIRDLDAGDNFQINGEAGIIFKLTELVSLKAGPYLRYVNVPPEGNEKLDITTRVAAIFNF